MDIIMFILLVAVVYLGMKHEVLPRWRNRRQQSCCVSSGSHHSSSADPPQSQQARRQRRRIRDRVPSGRRNRRNRRASGRDSGGNTATGAAGTASSTTSSKRTRWLPRWRPSWQQIAASLVIVALLLGNVIQAFTISGLDDRIDDLEERSNTPSAVDTDSPYAAGDSDDGNAVNAAQAASGSNDPEVVEEECASEVHFFARETANGYWGPEVDAKTHQAAVEELGERVCKDPALLTGLRTRFGLNDIGFDVEEQVAQGHTYIDDRDAWRSAVGELMQFINTQDVRLGIENGHYETFYMDTSRGGVPWIFQDTRTAGERVVLRVGGIDLQLLCGFQPREAAPEPTPAPTRQPAPTQPAPEQPADDEPPARQVRQEPPSEEESPENGEEEEPPAEEPSDDDAAKVRVCDTRNGRFVIVRIEHAREFDHFAPESHPACQPDEDDGDDGDDEPADDVDESDKPDQSHDCQQGNPGATGCPSDETDERQSPDGSDHPDSEPEGSTEDPEGEQIEEPDEAPVVEDTTPGDEGESPAQAPHPDQAPKDGADSGGDESGDAPESSTDNDGNTPDDQSDDSVQEGDSPDNEDDEVPDDEGGSDADNPSDGIVDGPGTAETSTASAG